MENYEKWKEEYYSKEKINLKNYFSEEDLTIIKKLGIELLDKVYTENEFEVLYSDILSFCDEETGEVKETIENKGITIDEYNGLLKKLDDINTIYGF